MWVSSDTGTMPKDLMVGVAGRALWELVSVCVEADRAPGTFMGL